MSHDVEQAVPADRSLAYWKALLAGLTPLDLPTDRPRPAIPARSGAQVSGRLSPELVARLRTLAHSADASLFMVLLAGFQALLSRWSGQADVTVGGASSDLAETESVDRAGLIATALPLRADLSDDPGLRVLLRRTRKAVLDGHQHRDVLLRRLAADVATVPGPGQPPLFTVVLSHLSAVPPLAREAPATAAPGWGPAVPEAAPGTGSVHFDLDVLLREEIGSAAAGAGVTVGVKYRTDLYDAATAERLLAHYIRLLEGAAESPHTPMSALSLSGPAELAQLARWGTNPVPHQRGALIPDLIAAHAWAQPERVAVLDGPRTLTYGELDRGAERLARRLRAHGVGRDVLVGVCLPRSAELVTVLLAVLKAGGAYLPLDPEYPAERLAFMLTDSGAPVVVANETVGTGLSANGVTVLLADDEPAGEAAAEPGPCGAPAPGDLAYAIYTSGSTGSPKGVLVDHHSLLNLCSWHNHYYRVTPADRATMLAAQSFDASVWELWPYLAAGASVAVVDPAARADPARLITWMKRAQVTMSFLPTPLAEAVLADDGCLALPLRALLTGGDTLHRRPRPGLPFTLVNHYGPTECSVVATATPVADTAAGTGAPSIGGPIDNVEVHLLDAQLRRVPLGVAGELYLGGDGVARGYLGRPELTRERFVTVPDAAPGARWYRTGDLARWRNDGTLEFLGRVDRQLKIRGHRIEPGEIEAQLMAHPQVAEALVVAHTIAPGNFQLVGYLTIHGAAPPNLAEIRSWLASRLPSVMVPAKLIVLAELPLTPGGKIDRTALPDPGELTGAPKTAPRTDAECCLTSIWAEVFGREPSEIGVEDSFFELGGDSIMSMLVAAQARRAGVMITPRQIFELRTPAALARVAVTADQEERNAEDIATGPAPLTPMMWHLAERNGTVARAGAQSARVAAPAGVTLENLTAAVEAVLRQHVVLRARLDEDNGVLDIPAPDDAPFRARDIVHRVDAPGLDDFARRELLDAETADAESRLDPAKGLMLQVVWLDPGPGGTGDLAIVAHHLVIDGVSWRVLLVDLATAHAALIAGLDQAVAERPPTSFRRWANELAARAATQETVSELDFWTGTLTGSEPLLGDLATVPETGDPATGAEEPTALVGWLLPLPADTATALLASVPAAFHASVDDVLLAGLAAAVTEWQAARGKAAEGILVDVRGHGRVPLSTDMDLSRTVGWFASSYPVRLSPGPVDFAEVRAGGPDAGRLIKRIKEQIRAVPGDRLGYGMLRFLNPATKPVLAALPEPQIGYNYTGRFSAAAAPGPGGQDTRDERARPVPAEGGLEEAAGDLEEPAPYMPLRHPLEVSGSVRDLREGPDMRLTLEVPADLLGDQAVADLGDRWLGMLHGFVAHVARSEGGGHTPSDFSLVSLGQEDIEEFESAFGERAAG